MSKHPPKLAFDLERDVRILSAMASSLTPYLYENEMYGYLEGDLGPYIETVKPVARFSFSVSDLPELRKK